ncbi:MAG TPA: DUF433 domain-containing protein [Ktedonobacterales bacterium]|nr:DUF433 domain-containing protein [Ktedonobacterales bacterium]
MKLDDYFEFLGPYEIRIRGHRVGLDLILNRYLAGKTPEEIAQEFHSIRLEDVYAAITYYLHNKDILDPWLSQIRETAKRNIAEHETHPSPVAARMRALWKERGLPAQ